MQTSYSVTCMLCGRASGQVRYGKFYKAPEAAPIDVRGGRSRCGFCGGNLYLEVDDSLMLPISTQVSGEPRRRKVS